MQDEAGAPLIAAHDVDAQPASQVRARRSLFVTLGIVAVATLAADQLTKAWALHSLVPGEPVNVVGSAIRLNLIRNAGAAFSIGHGATWVLTLIACAVLVFTVVTARRLGSVAWAWALGLLLGGSVGNLVDRVVRPPAPGRGHVVDFIDYFGWFIGNVADVAIVGAAVFIATLAMRGLGVDGSRPHQGRHEDRSAEASSGASSDASSDAASDASSGASSDASSDAAGGASRDVASGASRDVASGAPIDAPSAAATHAERATSPSGDSGGGQRPRGPEGRGTEGAA
jgi:signal peptidase II